MPGGDTRGVVPKQRTEPSVAIFGDVRAAQALNALRKWDVLEPLCPFGCSGACGFTYSPNTPSPESGRSPAASESPRSSVDVSRTNPFASLASITGTGQPNVEKAAATARPSRKMVSYDSERWMVHSHFVRTRALASPKTQVVRSPTAGMPKAADSDSQRACYVALSLQCGHCDTFCVSALREDARMCGAVAEEEYRAAIVKETEQKKVEADPTPILNGRERAIAAMRSVVSQNKIRFQEDGFDLDLTYITPRIIAMGFPSTGRESYFRNPMSEVERFFVKRHPNHFRVYNLCREREYDIPSRFGGQYRRFPFDDHNAPNDINIISELVSDASHFLAEDEDNVVAIHCKAGKGRTGMMISCLLMSTEPTLSDPRAALDFFSKQRTNDGQGVTIPSQMRYVGYWEKVLKAESDSATQEIRTLYVNRIQVHSLAKAKVAAPIDMYFIVHHGLTSTDIFDSRRSVFTSTGPKLWLASKGCYCFDFISGSSIITSEENTSFNMSLSVRAVKLSLSGDIKITFYSKNKLMADEELFHFWFNTTLCDYPELRIDKMELDGGPAKDRKHSTYAENLAVSLLFEAPEWVASIEHKKNLSNLSIPDSDEPILKKRKKKNMSFFSRVFRSNK